MIIECKHTQAEILERIEARNEHDFFGFETSQYVMALTFANAKPYLRDDTTDQEWSTENNKTPLQVIRDYMPFAWEKANGFRGLSAGRSIQHMTAWIWLNGDDDFSAEIQSDPYEFYGKDLLVKICQRYGIDATTWDDGVRQNSELLLTSAQTPLGAFLRFWLRG